MQPILITSAIQFTTRDTGRNISHRKNSSASRSRHDDFSSIFRWSGYWGSSARFVLYAFHSLLTFIPAVEFEMLNVLTCPSCKTEIEVSEIMTAQLSATIRAEMEAQLAAERRTIGERARLVEEQEHSLQEERGKFELQIQARLAGEEQRLLAEARATAAQELSQEIAAREGKLQDLQSQLQKSRSAELDLLRREGELQSQQERMDIELQSKLNAEREQIRKQAFEQADQRTSVVLREQAQQLTALQSALTTAQQNELDLRKKKHELEQQKAELQLEVARTLDVERAKIRDEVLHQADEQNRLKIAEKDKLMAEMQDHIQQLKRKAEQGSQQIQGEVLELDLEAQLRDAFSADDINEVPKGVSGGDLLHNVRSVTGRPCGVILWESKRTKNWSSTWLPKLRDDMRAAGAACAVLVSEALPDGVRSFNHIDGIWVCNRSHAIVLALVLRAGMIEVTKARQAAEGRQEKTDLVYSYLCSGEFQHHLSGLVESFAQMQSDLDSEERSMKSIWKKRRKQIERGFTSTTGLYGDLQGLMGNALKEIRHLELQQDQTDLPEDSAA